MSYPNVKGLFDHYGVKTPNMDSTHAVVSRACYHLSHEVIPSGIQAFYLGSTNFSVSNVQQSGFYQREFGLIWLLDQAFSRMVINIH